MCCRSKVCGCRSKCRTSNTWSTWPRGVIKEEECHKKKVVTCACVIKSLSSTGAEKRVRDLWMGYKALIWFLAQVPTRRQRKRRGSREALEEVERSHHSLHHPPTNVLVPSYVICLNKMQTKTVWISVVRLSRRRHHHIPTSHLSETR